MSSYYTFVAGVTKNNDDGTDRQKFLKKCKRGEEVTLVRDPANKYDKNAIKVCKKTGEQLGWIEKSVAESLALIIDNEIYSLNVKITELPKNRGVRGCKITMTAKEIEKERTEPIPICPYCDFKLDKMPSRKKKCPNCKEDIYVRFDPKIEQYILLNDENKANEMSEQQRLIKEMEYIFFYR